MLEQTIILFLCNFCYVGLKAAQQRHVAFDNCYLVIPTSLAIAAAEVYVIATIAVRGYSALIVITMGLAAGCGALSAMWIHKRFIKKGN